MLAIIENIKANLFRSWIGKTVKRILDFMADKLQVRTLNKLGILGTINYIGALLVLTIATRIDYSKELFKGIAFLISGISLLFFSGWMYYLISKEKTSIVHGALNSLTQVFQRIPEQVDKTRNNDEVKTLMGAVEGYPDKIINLIKDIETKI